MVSLGCARNRVDSEIMTGRLLAEGWTLAPDPAQADTIVVNTCSFIDAAVNESIDTILDLARHKQRGTCRRLIVVGCLPERYREKIIDALPEVDCFLGTGAFDEIMAAADPQNLFERCCLPDPGAVPPQAADHPRLLTHAHTAYLKIAEGCNRLCTYCMIPRLRGRQKSRPLATIVAEARILIDAGVRELNLVAQDTTAYGLDLCPPAHLAGLLDALAGLDPQVWIRLLYGHPESIDAATIAAMARHPNICPYFDIPIQHASPSVLKKMGRGATAQTMAGLFDHIRAAVPQASLRTTVMVGFPGETTRDFNLLLDFVTRVQFDHLGAFVYCDAPELAAHGLARHVAAATAKKRFNRIMALQKQIAGRCHERHIGRIYPVLIEQRRTKATITGRTMFQAPEVDGVVVIKDKTLAPGQVVPLRIVEVRGYDLMGKRL